LPLIADRPSFHDVIHDADRTKFHWTLTGTNTEPGDLMKDRFGVTPKPTRETRARYPA